MVNVPAQYDPLIREMSQATGIPYDVIAAQANLESGFKSTARSPAGALGWLQFLPSTYDSYAKQAGVASGTEFNPASEAKVYDVYMSTLIKQEKGNLRNALAAYNAGPGNIQAGLGYADKILGASGQAQTTGIHIPNPLNLLPDPLNPKSISGILGHLLEDMRDVFERLGLILLGAALILMGIHLLSGGNSGQSTTVVNQIPDEKSSGGGKSSGGKGLAKGEAGAATKGLGASSAVEAAAIA